MITMGFEIGSGKDPIVGMITFYFEYCCPLEVKHPPPLYEVKHPQTQKKTEHQTPTPNKGGGCQKHKQHR